jgi:putative addiction module component (TIGR02574 family)
MSKTFTEVWQEAAELTEEERASLAGLLIDSLEGEADPGVEEAWAAEIQKRVAQVEAGTAKTVPWEEVRQRLISRLNAR